MQSEKLICSLFIKMYILYNKPFYAIIWYFVCENNNNNYYYAVPIVYFPYYLNCNQI